MSSLLVDTFPELAFSWHSGTVVGAQHKSEKVKHVQLIHVHVVAVRKTPEHTDCTSKAWNGQNIFY